jgi:hypothetical protein
VSPKTKRARNWRALCLKGGRAKDAPIEGGLDSNSEI